MGNKAKISVLIVTYNNAGTINACLDSLAAQSFDSLEILIRDNASADNTLALLENRGDVNLYACKENIGFGAAMNYLASKANGKYLFLLNPDSVCPNDLLEQLYTFAQIHPGAISPALEYPDGSAQPSARVLPTYSNIIFSRRSPLYWLGLAKTSSAGYLSPESDTKVPAVSATALFIEKGIFTGLDGFDQRFFMYGEDLDLCKRLGDAHHDIWYLPELKVKHVLGESSKRVSLRTSYYHHCSILKYFTKHYPGCFAANFVLGLLLAGGLCFSVLMKLIGIGRKK